MVNTGSPSKACKLCLSRRVTCDKAKPFCRKCVKANRVCPGYRDAFEIKLRDETQSTIRKAKAAQQRKRPAHKGTPSPQSLDKLGGSSDGDRQADADLVAADGTLFGHYKLVDEHRLPRSLQTPLDQLAECYFLSHYVLLPSGPGRGINTFLLSLPKTDEARRSPLPAAFLATAMAALSNRPNARSLVSRARLCYSRALKEVNAALQDPRVALLDTSLAAVIMLSVYEGLSPSGGPFTAWSNHLDGAKALIRLRAKKGLVESAEAVEMFAFVRASMIRQFMFSFVAGNPSSEEIGWWGKTCLVDPVSHKALLLNLETTLIRADADRILAGGPRTADKIEKTLDLLRRAKAVLAELSHWIDVTGPDSTPPSPSSPTTTASSTCSLASTTPPPFYAGFSKRIAGYVPPASSAFTLHTVPAFPGPVFSFPNIWVAAKHLNTEASRLILADVVARCTAWICHPASPAPMPDHVEAEQCGKDAVASVVSSIPYFLAWDGGGSDESTNPLSSSSFLTPLPDDGAYTTTTTTTTTTGSGTSGSVNFPCGEPGNAPKGFAVMSCLCPLFATGSSRFASPHQKRYIYGRLMWISETIGMGTASVFAKFMSNQF